jgi:RHH-type transcriptional regulator, proline utilization regulon repressor / proline dehydrogenase / delta 1-pyrroline-5-carboxylate dehydrogenase
MAARFLEDRPPLSEDPRRARIREAHRADEAACVAELLELAAVDDQTRARIRARALELAGRVRHAGGDQLGVEAFLHEYRLSTREGIMLMCLAEALLRIPDAETADRLIRDKLSAGEWSRHLGQSGSLLVNASTWGLMLTGRFVRTDLEQDADPGAWLTRLLHRLGEPVLRQALLQAMRVLGRHFVLGQTIEQAIRRAREAERKGYRYSYDMLGEAARTATDAARYHAAYRDAIAAISEAAEGDELMTRPGISIKLSALHPRYELAQHRRLHAKLYPRLLELLAAARAGNIAVTIDAEETDRLEPSLDLFERLAVAPELAGWDGLGLAVQAYQKRAIHVIAWLEALAARARRRIPVRLVKGAYWDTEIKRTQEHGLGDYPVFTRKLATDVSYLACARRLLAGGDAFYAQFATHNAQTLGSIIELAGDRRDFEFQRLHGMGEALYQGLVGAGQGAIACRVYAPVGSHQDLLPYLVRRLLENGANTSFVNRILDENVPLETLIEDPVSQLARLEPKRHPRIPLPRDLYGPERRNSRGIDLRDPPVLEDLAEQLDRAFEPGFQARPGIGNGRGEAQAVLDPADRSFAVGSVIEADPETIEQAVREARAGFAAWERTPLQERVECLRRAADLYEANAAELLAWCVREGGKTLPDAVAEVREAVDFLRYYAMEAQARAAPRELPGPTGESNRLALHGRGVFVAISPWNFPLAIFTGQIAAALAVGNAVLAKPAPQTPLIAAKAVALLHQARVPEDALILLPGGPAVGARLVDDSGIAGVAFTGSTHTAWAINRALATKDGPIAPLIAETGGQNAMLVDSSALPEQVVADVLESSFRSAGQRCSALRVLCVQDDIAPRVLEMLAGAMLELEVGDPGLLATDVGPVIDEAARQRLEQHAARMMREGRLIQRVPLRDELARGCFFAPHAFEIDAIAQLEGEVFGPILHLVRFAGDRLAEMIDAVNATGYGLTLGVHSRIDQTIDLVLERARAGNIYVNRNMIGAVVGVQPFGGERLSGTGPKAGGPHYLARFATERTVSVNTAAVGGNASLLSLEDDARTPSGAPQAEGSGPVVRAPRSNESVGQAPRKRNGSAG